MHRTIQTEPQPTPNDSSSTPNPNLPKLTWTSSIEDLRDVISTSINTDPLHPTPADPITDHAHQCCDLEGCDNQNLTPAPETSFSQHQLTSSQHQPTNYAATLLFVSELATRAAQDY